MTTDPIFGCSMGSGFGDLWIHANNLAFLSSDHP